MACVRMLLGLLRKSTKIPWPRRGLPEYKTGLSSTHHVGQPQYCGVQLHGLRPVEIVFHGHKGHSDTVGGGHLEFAGPRVGLVERVAPQPLEVDGVYQQHHGGWVYCICKQLTIRIFSSSEVDLVRIWSLGVNLHFVLTSSLERSGWFCYYSVGIQLRKSLTSSRSSPTLWNSEVHYSVHNSPPLVPVLR